LIRPLREAERIRGLLASQGEMIGPYDILLAAQLPHEFILSS
jgi:hypothetical protein